MFEGFKKDDNIEYLEKVISYVQEENEDNFFEIIECNDVVSSGAMLVVQYYKSCTRVKTEIFGKFDNYEPYIKESLKEIYSM